MRRTISRVAISFAGLLTESNTKVDISGRIEEIRAAMVDALRQLDTPPSQTCKAIVQAADVQTLWYLRSDLMREISSTWGEDAARLELKNITELFRGVVAQNQMPRAKQLGR